MISKIKKILFFLSPNDRKKALGLSIMVIITAILDLVGVASILPFISTLTNPQIIKTNKYLAYIYDILNFKDIQSFLFFLGVLVFLITLVSLAFKSLTIYYQLRFNQIREFTISQKLIINYLSQPYSWFLNKNSADVGNNLLKEVNQVVVGAMAPIMNIFAQSLVAIAMTFLVIVMNPKLAIISALFLTFVYGSIYFVLRGYLFRIGSKRIFSSQKKHRIINEAFYGIKELKVGGLEKVYYELFSKPAETFAKTNAKLQVLMQIPRYGIEAVCFGGIILVILYLMRDTGNFINSLPLLSVYSLAAYRLIPAIQLIYSNLVQFKSATASIDLLFKDITELPKLKKINEKFKKIKLVKDIKLRKINFTYVSSKSKTLNDVNITIPAKQTIGLIGPSGCGKTTTVDLILALFQPDSGTIKVDDTLINETNMRSWQSTIGYVPQQIFLIDDTISSNIAFGVNKENVDFEQVKRVAKIANLHEFITKELIDGYDSMVGERGIRLSGGQRQRIGIARALYHNPQLLILDEATSALDNATEKSFLDALKKLSGKITIIMIAHRISTLKDADKIYLMKKGEVIAEGDYNKILDESFSFKEFINNTN